MIDNDKIYFDLERAPLASERKEKRELRKRRILTSLLCLFFLLIGLLAGYFINKVLYPSEQVESSQVMGEIEYAMENQWLYSDQYDDLKTELEDKAFYGMTSFEDDVYTSYMSAKEMDEFSTGINMDYVGIGVQYSKNEDLAIVVKVFKGSPAELVGIKAGDIIKAVDGADITDMTSDEVKERVIGPEGTDVVITVTRDGKDIDCVCTRASINSSVYAYRENDYVVLELNSFGTNTAQECVKYLDEYTDLEKIIIDVRDDSGGYQTSVQELCGLFIGPNKVYLRQKGVDGKESFDYTNAIRHYTNFKKIVILINENTASAAEVFAIALKEQHPGVRLVGTTSYGKGVIQTNKMLSNGGVLKMTAYYWYSPNGNSIHNVGVTPDQEVRMHDVYYEYFTSIDEGVTYELDSVSEFVRISQLALDYLDYDVARTDGYFDQSFATALNKFKVDRGMANDSILDSLTFNAIVSAASREIVDNPIKDYQLVRAKEILSGN